VLAYQHCGFSVDAGVCIQAHDRAGLARLLRYCAGPPFFMGRLRKAGSEPVYRWAKLYSKRSNDKAFGSLRTLHVHGQKALGALKPVSFL